MAVEGSGGGSVHQYAGSTGGSGGGAYGSAPKPPKDKDKPRSGGSSSYGSGSAVPALTPWQEKTDQVVRPSFGADPGSFLRKLIEPAYGYKPVTVPTTKKEAEKETDKKNAVYLLGRESSTQVNLIGQGPKPEVDAKTLKLNQAKQAREERERLLRLDPKTGLLPDEPDEAKPMTREEYNALGPRQRAAVDFNTMLVQAVEKDKRLHEDYKPTADQKATYEKTVEKLFGEDGGSEVYAPETLGVLKQIGYKDPAADLDDFLSLRAAIGEDDIPHLTKAAQHRGVYEGVEGLGRERVELGQVIAERTAQMQETLARGSAVLQSFNATAKAALNDELKYLGGVPNEVELGIGYGPAQFDQDKNAENIDAYFQVAFDKLAQLQDPKQVDAFLADVKSDMDAEGDDFQLFLNYADTRAKNAERYDTSLGADPKVQYRTPEEFSRLLGREK